MSAMTAARPRRMTRFPDPSNPRGTTDTTSRRFDSERSPKAPADVQEGPHWRDEFDRIVGSRLDRLHRLAHKILRSEDLADDAVQEALVSLWRRDRPPPNIDGWLVQAVVHRSLHLNRTRHRRRKHEAWACLGCPEYDPNGDASRPLEVAEFAEAVRAALDRLPEHLRTVLVLRETEQMDYESIAESLRVPVGTVRSRLNRSRKELRETFRSVLPDDPGEPQARDEGINQ